MDVEHGEQKHLGRLGRHVLSQLVCMGRHTMTNLLTTSGRQFIDWSSDYRMYSENRIECDSIFAHVTKEIMSMGNGPFITAMDDSLLRKTGKKIPGVKFARDPMGPPFQVNFVRGQRVIQMSAAVAEGSQSRMIPVIFRDASTPDKPKRNAAESQWETYREECKNRRLSVLGCGCIQEMRSRLDSSRKLWVAVDGSYTNKTVLNNLPENTVIIGRMRSDAKLHYPPEPFSGPGRKRVYGDQAPAPAEVRTDENIPWLAVPGFTSGKAHEFKVKVLKDVKWRGSGKLHTVQVIVIAPLRYRLSKGSRLLYRDPAYLICTDPNLTPQEILQAYLWRWDIEINFRDEKNLLGTGQAQVRNPASVKSVPQMMVASYSLLLLAGIKLWGLKGIPQLHNIPKWQNPNNKHRASTCDLIKQLRYDLWADSIASVNLTHFASKNKNQRSRLNQNIPAFSAIFHVNPG